MSTCDRVLVLPTGIAPSLVSSAHAPAFTVYWKRADPATSTSSVEVGSSLITTGASSTTTSAPTNTVSSIPYYGPGDTADTDMPGTGDTMDNGIFTVLSNGTSTFPRPVSPSGVGSASDGVPFGVGLAISIIVPLVIISLVALALLLYRRRRLRDVKPRSRERLSESPVPRGEAFHELHAEDIPLPPDHTPTAWIPRLPVELVAPKPVDDVDTTIRRLRSERERVREHLQRLRMMEELEAEERRLEKELQDRLEIED